MDIEPCELGGEQISRGKPKMFRSWHAMGTSLSLILLHSYAANAQQQHPYAASPEARWYVSASDPRWAYNANDPFAPPRRVSSWAEHHAQHLRHFVAVRHDRDAGKDAAKDPDKDGKAALSSLKKEMLDLHRQVDAVETMRQELTDLKEKIWGPTPLPLTILPRPQSIAVVEPKSVTLKLPDIGVPARPQAPRNPATASLPAVIEERSEVILKAKSAVEEAKAYLIDTATPGYTMLRQGVTVAIGRLHPDFIVKLASAVQLARSSGLDHAGIYSAYRPPIFGVGGFSDKFNSLHSYGLAADMTGIGSPGSKAAKLWQSVVTKVGLYLPYGPNNHVEFNHTQLVPTRIAPSFLRGTITASAPKDLQRMWLASGDKAHVDEVSTAVVPILPAPPALASVSDADKQLPLPQVPERRAMPRATPARPSRRRNAPPRERTTERQVGGPRRRSGRAGRNLAWMHWVLRPF
jgi:hypothetical protein